MTTTELSFLIDLLLHHKLPSKTKEAISGRIKEVEASLATQPTQVQPRFAQPPIPRTQVDPTAQAPSTQAILNGEKPAATGSVLPTAPQVLVPPTSPAAAAALQDRMAIINQALAGKGSEAPKLGTARLKST